MTTLVERSGKIWAYTTLSLPVEVRKEAKDLKINMSRVCTRALEDEIRIRKEGISDE